MALNTRVAEIAPSACHVARRCVLDETKDKGDPACHEWDYCTPPPGDHDGQIMLMTTGGRPARNNEHDNDIIIVIVMPWSLRSTTPRNDGRVLCPKTKIAFGSG